MKLQFKVQAYQTAAVDAVIDCFAGQPKHDPVRYLLDPGRRAAHPAGLFTHPRQDADSGLRNADLELEPDRLLDNIQAVQRERNLALSDRLVGSKAAGIGVPNLDVEMETGTGKTYVYIKTIMELHQRYGWGKYIVVVPSVAIREGVKKSFDITAEHFLEHYGTRPRAFVYNSSQLHELERFSSDSGVQVMIINIQAFNATGKDQRRIYEELDDFQSRRPIDVIAANRPIVIIDEPQKMGGEKSLAGIAKFRALAVLRYSATHRETHNKVHRLDALDAYNDKLVKRIAVRGITVKGLAGSTAYLYLDSIHVRKGALPSARVEIEAQTAGRTIVRKMVTVTKGSRLHDLARGVEAYRDLVVTDVDAVANTIELSNGDTVIAGQLADRDVTEESKRRIQIREVIDAHLDKERELFGRGIKVLSLFFIDAVAKYRDYTREDTLGDYARVFEEEYAAAVDRLLGELPLGDGTADYQALLRRDPVRSVHAGYFSIDKKSGNQVDNDKEIKKTGEEKGQSTDTDAYDLILKDKERLLSRDEPVRFIFSHSALREGWDNPNVFTLGMLKKSDNTISRRQEVGRGLRLAVDQHGDRMDRETVGDRVQDINELTVVTDESYTDFVSGLQHEIAESLSARPRKATVAFFTGKIVSTPDGDTVIEQHVATALYNHLVRCGYVDDDGIVTQQYKDDKAGGTLTAPDSPLLAPIIDYVYPLIDTVYLDVAVIGEDGRRQKRIPLNEKNFHRREFQQLWANINHRAVYQVQFDSAELVRNCVAELDAHLQVVGMQYVVQAGVQQGSVEADQLAAGTGFAAGRIRTEKEQVTASSRVAYDLLGEITEKTQLTRRTVAAILTGISPGTFAAYRRNPEQFITEAARLINEQKAAAVVEHLSYDTLAAEFGSAIFTENQTKVDFAKAVATPAKSVYEYLVPDSDGERWFAAGYDGETSSAKGRGRAERFGSGLEGAEEVAVYAKLPRGFFIPTPVGNYNPDWAIAFKDGAVKHVYFVAETKGALSSLELRGAEKHKIDCARKFFAALAEQHHGAVTYDVVTDYAQLMQLVK